MENNPIVIPTINRYKENIVTFSKGKKSLDYSKENGVFEGEVALMTNLFQVKIDPDKSKGVYLFGISAKEIYPGIKEDYPLQFIKDVKKDKVFNEKLNDYVKWSYISGLLLFGKIISDEVKNFKINLLINKTSNESKIIEEKDLDNALSKLKEDEKKEQKDEVKLYSFEFGRKMELYKYTESNSKIEKDASTNQIFRNYINVIIGKILKKANYIKDATSRKIVYYKQTDVKDAKELLQDKELEIKDLYTFQGLKAISDIYAGGKIFLKLHPKSILMNKSTYMHYYKYLLEINGVQQAREIFVKKVKNMRGLKLYNFKTEKIEDVIFENPYKIKFTLRNNKETSVGEYMIDVYQRKLEDCEQPIAIRYIDKGGKISKEDCQKLYMPMELLQVIGNIYEAKINVKKLIESPNDRMKNIYGKRKEIKDNFEKTLAEEGRQCIDNCIDGGFKNVVIKAPILKAPMINFKDSQKCPDKGSFDVLQTAPLKIDYEIKNVVIFYTTKEVEAQEILDGLLEAGKTMNIPKLAEKRTFVDIYKQRTEEFKQNLDSELTKVKNEKKYDFIFFFLDFRDTNLYKIIKNLMNEKKIKLCSQVIKYDPKKMRGRNLSLFTNVLCQIFAKNGEQLYGIDFSFAKNVLVISYAVMGYGDNKLVTSLAISITSSKSTYAFYSQAINYNRSKIASNIKEMLKQALLEQCPYLKHEVEYVLVYREGVNEKQIIEIKSQELEQFLEAIDEAKDEIQKNDKFEQKIKKRFSNPKVCFIIANKINEIKAFAASNVQNSDDISDAQFENCPLGTIIDKKIVSDEHYDFHLSSTYSGQGTASMTHYTVIYDDTGANFTAEKIYKITYYLCYICFNTTKSIKIPAPLYFVTRRNKFTRDNLDNVIYEKMKLFNVSL